MRDLVVSDAERNQADVVVESIHERLCALLSNLIAAAKIQNQDGLVVFQSVSKDLHSMRSSVVGVRP